MDGSKLAISFFEGFHLLKSHWLLVLASYAFYRVVYNAFFHPLAKHPGPWLAKVSDFWKARAVFRCSYRTELSALHKRYGDVVRIGPNEVSIVAPEQVRELYGHGSHAWLKGPFYTSFTLGGVGIFAARDRETHARLRRNVAAAYALHHVQMLEHFCHPRTHLLLGHLGRAAEARKVIDVAELVKLYAYDTVAAMSFGEDYNLLQNGKDVVGITAEFDSAAVATDVAGTLHWFGWIFAKGWPARILGFFKKSQAVFLRVAQQLVQKRETLRTENAAAYAEYEDMMFRFMESTDSATGKPLTYHDVVRECKTLIAAGADTTRISMISFLRHVYDCPRALGKLRAEMDEAQARLELDLPPTHAQAAKLEYFQATIKEAMRLHPVVGMTFQRVVPEGGRVLGGRYFPAGALVGMSAWETHYDRRAYGESAAQFRPERWFDENRNELEKYNLAFGQGSRVCLGKNIALLEMSVSLSAIVQKYDLNFSKLSTGQDPYVTSEHWLTPQQGFFCTINQRPI